MSSLGMYITFSVIVLSLIIHSSYLEEKTIIPTTTLKVRDLGQMEDETLKNKGLLILFSVYDFINVRYDIGDSIG